METQIGMLASFPFTHASATATIDEEKAKIILLREVPTTSLAPARRWGQAPADPPQVMASEQRTLSIHASALDATDTSQTGL